MLNKFKEYCRNGDLENAQLLLHQNPNIDIHSNNEEAFRLSCHYGHIEIAKWLHCTAQSAVSLRSACGESHTSHNATHCETEHSSVNIHAENEYAFRWSCQKGYIEIAKWLHSLGVDIHAQDEYVFRYSCQNGRIEIAKWLYSLGADIHANNEDAFCGSCANGHIEIAKWLYCTAESAVSLSSACGESHTPHNATHYETELRSVDINAENECAFRMSCYYGHIEIAKWLYSLGVDIHAQNEWAFNWSCYKGRIEIVKWLHSLGVNIHVDNEIAFHWSCSYGYIEIAKWLYLLGVDIHANNEDAFHYSCKMGHIEIAKWLHELGVDIHAMNEYAFRSSCAERHIEIVKWLCEIGVIITNDMFNKNYTYEVKKLLVKYTPCAIYARSALYNELIKNYPEDEVKAQFRAKMNEYDIEEDEFDYALKFNECTIEINAEQNEMMHSSIKAKYQELITYFQIT